MLSMSRDPRLHPGGRLRKTAGGGRPAGPAVYVTKGMSAVTTQLRVVTFGIAGIGTVEENLARFFGA